MTKDSYQRFAGSQPSIVIHVSTDAICGKHDGPIAADAQDFD